MYTTPLTQQYFSHPSNRYVARMFLPSRVICTRALSLSRASQMLPLALTLRPAVIVRHCKRSPNACPAFRESNKQHSKKKVHNTSHSCPIPGSVSFGPALMPLCLGENPRKRPQQHATRGPLSCPQRKGGRANQGWDSIPSSPLACKPRPERR